MLFEKREKTSRKEAKKGGKCNNLCHDMIFVCRDTKFKQVKGTMSQPATKCRNKAQTELNGWKRNFVAIKSFSVATKSFSVATLLKKIVKKTVATILDSVTTMIKAESKEAVS